MNHKYTLQKLFNDNRLKIDDVIYSKQLDEIIKYIVDKMENKYKLFENLITDLKEMINYSNIETNDIKTKEEITKQLTKLLNCKSDNANFKFLSDKYSLAFGKKNGRIITKFKLNNISTSGVHTNISNIGE